MTNETWTVLKIIQWTTEYLKGKGIDNPRLDSEVLLAHLLRLDRVGLYLNFDRPLSRDELSSFREIVKRRGSREPLQYITGHQEFWSLDFKVTPDVLIPRPDTEILVEEALKAARAADFGMRNAECGSENKIYILDICTGSGCIAVSLAKELENAVICAVDASEAPLSIAKENAALNGVNERVCFQLGDLYKAVNGSECFKSAIRNPQSAFDIIVSNPPYIKNSDIPHIQPEVRDYEPRMAVDGGADGLDFYKRIVADAPNHLSLHGWLMVEVGEGQADAVSKMMADAGAFEDISTVKDLAGIERVVKARKAYKLMP